jgi:glycosyltransferase involved in cell wall biosynthesis
MKTLQISSYDIVGEQFNGLALHREMRARGLRSRMLVHRKDGTDIGVDEIVASPRRMELNKNLGSIELRLSLHSVLPIYAGEILRHPWFREADVVHLQLMHATRFFSLFRLPKLARKKPTVWTVHDPWLMTGRCIHPFDCQKWQTGCGGCPDLRTWPPTPKDRSALNFRIKRRALRKSPIHLVFASQWMKQRAMNSPILQHLPMEVIPFGVQPDIFRPGDQTRARAQFGIPADADVLCFRCVHNPVNFKGTQYIEQALTAYRPRKPTYLITFDNTGGFEALREKYTFVELGWISDRKIMAQALRAADLCLMPSVAESFGVLAIESMACGTPVVCFEGTALPSVIDAPRCGVAVEYRNAQALREAIEGLLNNPQRVRSLSAEGLKLVEREYTFDRYVERHLALYERLAQQSRGVQRVSVLPPKFRRVGYSTNTASADGEAQSVVVQEG